MRVLISSLFLFPGKVGGAENYLYNLLIGFRVIDKSNLFSILKNKNIKYDSEIMSLYQSEGLNIWFNRGFYDYLTGLFCKDIKRYDLIFSPNYITSIFPIKTKKVTTIHDVQYLHYPEFFTKPKRTWLYFSHLITLKLADRVVCISNSVKSDIIKNFGDKYACKLEVIYNPVDFGRFGEGINVNKLNVPEKYILSVAAQYPHKNLLVLIKSFNKLSYRLNYKLVLVGQIGDNLVGGYGEYSKKIKDEISKNKDNIIVTGYITDEYLGVLYSNCTLFVFPSLFEGFGMPPVEAMGLGVPTITTRCASLEEVTLGNAIYINNPEDDGELLSLIESSLANLTELNERFASYSDDIRQKYSPANISKKYFDLFERVIHDKD